MKVILQMEFQKEKENLSGLPELLIKTILKMIKETGKVSIHGQTEITTKVILWTAILQEKVKRSIKMVKQKM